ncbi:phytoene/squalene synthase family protein [Candidatus Gracilibacteria bacterium]|nr:phytoene/squalene synthase family protein [Candidatus Gracilibacteria bacterium]
MNTDPRYFEGLAEAKRINKQHGTSYYFATRLFPPDIRNAVHVLYAFFRLPDEIVDTSNDASLARSRLLEHQQHWQAAYQQKSSSHPVLHASQAVFHHYGIPYHYSESFFAAMLQDTEKSTYATYEELERYMYGSAAVVGLMLTYIIGFSNPLALGYAEKLGYAMQLTNFLRDIDEDWQQRQRIYLPQSELQSFQINDTTIHSRNCNQAFVQMLKWQIARARQLYLDAEQGIAMLHPSGQLAVKVASRLYAAILKKIEDQNYNIFAGRARTSKAEKIWLLAQAMVR